MFLAFLRYSFLGDITVDSYLHFAKIVTFYKKTKKSLIFSYDKDKNIQMYPF